MAQMEEKMEDEMEARILQGSMDLMRSQMYP